VGKNHTSLREKKVLVFHRVPAIPVRFKDRDHIIEPFVIIGMVNILDMGKDMGIVPVYVMSTRAVSMLDLIMLCLYRMG